MGSNLAGHSGPKTMPCQILPKSVHWSKNNEKTQLHYIILDSDTNSVGIVVYYKNDLIIMFDAQTVTKHDIMCTKSSAVTLKFSFFQ